MSDWYQIESHTLTVQLTTKGAELKRLFSKEKHRELLWLGDTKTWNRSAPVLFPIVGKLKDDEYVLKGKTFKMSQHGFARDMEFKCTESSSSEVEFFFEATQETFNMYPFCFELRIRYKLENNKLTVWHFVKNVDRQEIYFSIGGHPAFETKNISHYEIRFEKEEKEYFQLKNGMVDWEKPYPFDRQKLELSADSFRNDAFIFRKLKSKYVDLVDTRRNEVIRVSGNTPYWGVWGKGDVPFVCVEPWYGVGDSEEHDKNFETKKGIIALGEDDIFGFSYSIEIRSL